MSIEDRAKATAKSVQGKMQEAMASVNRNPEDKVEGKEKQAEADAKLAQEDAKDDVKKAVE